MATHVRISLEEILTFHTIDRVVYTRLLYILRLDPYTAKKIMGFWFWLESKLNIRVRDAINLQKTYYLIQSLQYTPNEYLFGLSKEAITCMNCLNLESPPDPILFDDDVFLPLTRKLVARGNFSLRIVYENKSNVTRMMERFIRNVAEIAFLDIDHANGPQPLTLFDPYYMHAVQVFPGVVVGSQPIPQPDHHQAVGITKLSLPQPQRDNHHEVDVVDVDEPAKSDDQVVPRVYPSDRTLLLTISNDRDNVLSNDEIKILVTRLFGNCVDGIYARVKAKMQNQFVQVVFKSGYDIEPILGSKEEVKFYTDGINILVRRQVVSQNSGRSGLPPRPRVASGK